MSRIFLGVNHAYHESAACLLVDGRIVAMAEEERFNRLRHGKISTVRSAGELPLAAMDFCLQHAGIGWADVDAIGTSLLPDVRLAANVGLADADRMTPGDWGSEAGERAFEAGNRTALDALRGLAPHAEVRCLPHHLCHAASAFLVSPFEQAAILVADGIGERDSTWLGLGSGQDMLELQTIAYPHSIGFVWEKFSEFLGLDAYSGPGKVMGYGCTTDPRGELSGHDHLSTMAGIFRPDGDAGFFVDNDAFRFRTDDFRGLERRFGARRPALVDRYEDASIAAALQTATSDVVVHLANNLHQRIAARGRPVTDLCIAGGVALNCVANYEIAARTPFERIWIQPAANDAGTALGAAVLLHLAAGGERPTMEHAFLGPGFDPDRMAEALRGAHLPFSTPDDIGGEVAARMERGEIVAWFQGHQEVGPRALGNRSILCDPSRFDSRTRINTRVKYRESFRPFAPSVLPRGVDRFFDVPAELLAARYMLFALPLREPMLKQVIPAVVQENGSTGVATSRIHVVQAAHNPQYAAVIEAFDGLTGLPLVLNTSFNVREPIVTTPEQAIATFLRSSMDALAMGPYLVQHPGGGAQGHTAAAPKTP